MAIIDAFATKEQMAERSQGAIPATTPFLEMALKAATREIRKKCGWHVAEEAQTTVVLDDTAGPIMSLPSGKVKSVDEIKVAGVVAPLSTIKWLPDGRLADTYYIPNFHAVEITVTHGYETIPEDLVDLTLQIAARALGAPLGYVREQAGAVSVTHSLTAAGVAGGTVVLRHELEQLGPYVCGWAP